jgi:hypothetical protein
MTERFYKLPKSLAAMPQREMPATAKIVMVILSDRLGHNATCWPGVRTIAADSGLTVETVIHCIGILEGAGLVTVDRRGSGKVNHYSISQSAQGIRAPKNLERPRNPNTGAQETSAQAPKILDPNQTDQLNQTHKRRKSAADKPPPDPRVKEFVDCFCKTYGDSLGRAYIVTPGKDGATIKRLLRGLGGDGRDPLAELQMATAAMLADEWGRERASIGLLAAQINTWLGGPGRTSGKRGGYAPAKVATGTSYDRVARSFSEGE